MKNAPNPVSELLCSQTSTTTLLTTLLISLTLPCLLLLLRLLFSSSINHLGFIVLLLCGPSVRVLLTHAGPQGDRKPVCFPLKTFPEAVEQEMMTDAVVIPHTPKEPAASDSPAH